MSTALNATPDGTNDPETTNDDKEIEEATENKEGAAEEEKQIKVTNYSWTVLGAIVAVRVCYQWMRAIFSYSYGYTGTGV